jgi:hypothetical protein
LEQLKLRADSEGLPYQTLLSSIVHKFVTDQLVDKKVFSKALKYSKHKTAHRNNQNNGSVEHTLSGIIQKHALLPSDISRSVRLYVRLCNTRKRKELSRKY